MINSKNELTLTASSKEVCKVYKTTDYERFTFLSNNRNINLHHVQRLKESFAKNYLISPIIVNKNMEIIDGQHRFKAARLSGLHIYYIVVDDYGINEVQIFNANQKNWTKVDFLEMFCSEGRMPYLQLKEFMTVFPEFGMQSAERIITLKYSAGSRKFKGKSMAMKDFEEGKLFIPDLKKSYRVARKLLDFKMFYKNFNRGTFVSATAPIFDLKSYNHNEMIKKMQKCPIKLQDCLNVEQYRLLFEDIWNWRRKDENKVSFRYLN